MNQMTRFLTIAILWLGIWASEVPAQVYQMRTITQVCRNGVCEQSTNGKFSGVCIGQLDDKRQAILSAGHAFVANPGERLIRVELSNGDQWERVRYRKAVYEPHGTVDLAGLEYGGVKLECLPIAHEGQEFNAIAYGYFGGKPELAERKFTAWVSGGELLFDYGEHLGGMSGGAIASDVGVVGIVSRHYAGGSRYRNSNYNTIRRFCTDLWGFVPKPAYEEAPEPPAEPVPDPLDLSPIDTPSTANKPCGLPWCKPSCDCRSQFAALWAKIQEIEGKTPLAGEPGASGRPGRDGQDGRPGSPPEHEVSDTGDAIRFKRPGGEWGPWVKSAECDIDAIVAEVLKRIPAPQSDVPAPPGADLKKTHIVLVTNQDAEYWPRLRGEFNRAKEVFSAMKLANPPDFTVELPQLVIYKDGTPVRQIVGLRNVSDTLNRMSRGDFDL